MRNFFIPSTNPMALKQILQIQAYLAGWLNGEFMPLTPRVASSCPKPQQTNPPTKKIKQTNKLRSNKEKHCEEYVSQALLNLA